jgi:quercetin dioxygenase-like cupin family protein
VVRGQEVPVNHTPWGSLQWLVAGASGTSHHMTLGRVTFKPGQSNPHHCHPNCEEILFVAAGQIEHSLPQGGTIRLNAGDAIIIPPGAPHQARNLGSDQAVVLVAFNSPQRQTIFR